MAACVTRILHLGGFSPAVTTKDVKQAFVAFEELYKIKWIDDTSLYLIFNDPRIAKSAFLTMMGNLPPQLLPAPNSVVVLSPYNGTDADAIIARVEHRYARSLSSRSEASTAPNSINLANVSPAVSLMLLAAVNAGPPGAINGVNGIGGVNGMGIANGFQGISGHSHNFTRRGSQTSLRSMASQASLADVYGFGSSASGYGLGVGSGSGMGGLSASSSWNNASPQFVPTTLNPYNDYPVAPAPHAPQVNGKHINVVPSGPQGLEDIAEASSREEISNAGSHELLPTPARESAALLDAGSNTKATCNSSKAYHPLEEPMGNGNTGSTSPANDSSDHAASPTQSPSAIPKKASLESLAKSFSELAVSSSSEGSAPGEGLRTPPEQTTSSPPAISKSTPPRIGNPGKRMLSHALGIRHPGLPPRVIAGVKQ